MSRRDVTGHDVTLGSNGESAKRDLQGAGLGHKLYANISEGNSFVENVMVQSICTVLRTPSNTKRTHYLPAPSSDSTIKKRENKLNSDENQTEKDCSDSHNESIYEKDFTILSDYKDRRTVKERLELSRLHTTISDEIVKMCENKPT